MTAAVLTLPVADAPPAPAPAPQRSPLEGMSPRRKAAVLVLALGLEEAAGVVAELSELELEELSTEIARLGAVPPEVSAAVMAEFSGLMFDDAGARGGMQAAHDLLRASVGFERAGEITERVLANFVSAPFASLQHLDPRQLVSVLSDEHPQTVRARHRAFCPAGLGSHILAGFHPRAPGRHRPPHRGHGPHVAGPDPPGRGRSGASG